MLIVAAQITNESNHKIYRAEHNRELESALPKNRREYRRSSDYRHYHKDNRELIEDRYHGKNLGREVLKCYCFSYRFVMMSRIASAFFGPMRGTSVSCCLVASNTA